MSNTFYYQSKGGHFLAVNDEKKFDIIVYPDDRTKGFDTHLDARFGSGYTEAAWYGAHWKIKPIKREVFDEAYKNCVKHLNESLSL